MFQDFFAGSNLLVWPVVGLLLFVAIFIGVLAFLFLGPRDQKNLDQIAALPLEPDDVDQGIAQGRAE